MDLCGGAVGERRREAWVWTAVVEEGNGRRWVDFEVGDRGEATFLELYATARSPAVCQRCLPGI